MRAAEIFLINTSLFSNFFCLFLPHPSDWFLAMIKFGVRAMTIVQPQHHEENAKKALVTIQRTTGPVLSVPQLYRTTFLDTDVGYLESPPPQISPSFSTA